MQTNDTPLSGDIITPEQAIRLMGREGRIPDGLFVGRMVRFQSDRINAMGTPKDRYDCVMAIMKTEIGLNEPWYESAVREGRISNSTYYLSVAQDAWLKNHPSRQANTPPRKTIDQLRKEQDHNANMAFICFAVGI